MAKPTFAGSVLVGIRADEAYSLDTFKAITGLGASALRSMRARGFKVLYEGGRAQVLGDEYLRFLREQGRAVK